MTANAGAEATAQSSACLRVMSRAVRLYPCHLLDPFLREAMATTLPKPDRKSRPIRFRPRIEPLEDRLAPAILEVVGSGGNGTTTFDTFDQAYNASTDNDVIQLEPSAGDVGSISFQQPHKATTLQGDPNFAIGSASEAVDSSSYGGVNFIHLWFNGMLDPGGNAYVYGCHLNGLAMQNRSEERRV